MNLGIIFSNLPPRPALHKDESHRCSDTNFFLITLKSTNTRFFLLKLLFSPFVSFQNSPNGGWMVKKCGLTWADDRNGHALLFAGSRSIRGEGGLEHRGLGRCDAAQTIKDNRISIIFQHFIHLSSKRRKIAQRVKCRTYLWRFRASLMEFFTTRQLLLAGRGDEASGSSMLGSLWGGKWQHKSITVKTETLNTEK